MRLALAFSPVIFVACGNDGSAKPNDAAIGSIDTPAAVDAKIDAAADAAPDAVIVPGTSNHYVLDQVLLPTNNTQTRDYGLDLDGDMNVDNQLGMVIATLTAQGFESQAQMSDAIDKGTVIMLGSVRATSLMSASLASFTIYQGANAVPTPCTNPQDTVCRKHLTGTGSFSLAMNAPTDPPLIGAITASKLTAGPGHLTAALAIGMGAPVLVTLIGARVELTTSGTALTGKIAGAVSQTDINTKVIPAMRDGFEATVMQECTMLASPPNCGCPSGSTAKTLLNLLDAAPQNCSISLAEVQNSSLIQALLAPDVTVEGKQAMSLGVAVTAVTGAFTDPM